MSQDVDQIRIQKWIADLGIASRREAERWIEKGRVQVNGKTVTLGQKANASLDSLSIDGRPVKQKNAPKVYWMLHKPHGYLTSKTDDRGRETIYDLPIFKKIPFSVPYVGRLDLKTTGLLLMSNDGDVNFNLTHPKFEVSRSYEVTLAKNLSVADQEKIVSNELKLEDGLIKKVKILRNKNGKELDRFSPVKAGNKIFIRAFEGRNRFVRRIFEKLENRVIGLHRFEFAGLWLPENLKVGQYQPLSSEHIQYLKK